MLTTKCYLLTMPSCSGQPHKGILQDHSLHPMKFLLECLQFYPISSIFFYHSKQHFTIQAISRDPEEENTRSSLGNTGETAREKWGSRLKIGACGTLIGSTPHRRILEVCCHPPEMYQVSLNVTNAT